MGEVVGEEMVTPLLVLPPFLAGQEKRLRERDRRVPMCPDGVDAKHARRFPVTPAAPVMLNGAKPEKGTQGFEERKVTASHRHAKDELQPRAAVPIGPPLSHRAEATLARDNTAQREADRAHELEEFRKKWRRWGSNPRSSAMPWRRSTRLSYAPGVDHGTSGHSGLVLLADRTHVR